MNLMIFLTGTRVHGVGDDQLSDDEEATEIDTHSDHEV